MLKYVGNALWERWNLSVNLKKLSFENLVIYCWIASHPRTSVNSFAHDSAMWAWIKQGGISLRHQQGKIRWDWKINFHCSSDTCLANCYSLSAGISAGIFDQWPSFPSSCASIWGFLGFYTVCWLWSIWSSYMTAQAFKTKCPKYTDSLRLTWKLVCHHWHRTHLQFKGKKQISSCRWEV